MTEASKRARPHYLRRLWAELGRMGGEQDAFIMVIIVERITKAVVLITLAIGLLTTRRSGMLTQWLTMPRPS